jgi:hypothetical protein
LFLALDLLQYLRNMPDMSVFLFYRMQQNCISEMNAESSRSHLIVGVVMESTNKSTGNVVKGKVRFDLSLLFLIFLI